MNLSLRLRLIEKDLITAVSRSVQVRFSVVQI